MIRRENPSRIRRDRKKREKEQKHSRKEMEKQQVGRVEKDKTKGCVLFRGESPKELKFPRPSSRWEREKYFDNRNLSLHVFI